MAFFGRNPLAREANLISQLMMARPAIRTALRGKCERSVATKRNQIHFRWPFAPINSVIRSGTRFWHEPIASLTIFSTHMAIAQAKNEIKSSIVRLDDRFSIFARMIIIQLVAGAMVNCNGNTTDKIWWQQNERAHDKSAICLDDCKFELNRLTNLMINKHNAKGKWSETTRLKMYIEI